MWTEVEINKTGRNVNDPVSFYELFTGILSISAEHNVEKKHKNNDGVKDALDCPKNSFLNCQLFWFYWCKSVITTYHLKRQKYLF